MAILASDIQDAREEICDELLEGSTVMGMTLEGLIDAYIDASIAQSRAAAKHFASLISTEPGLQDRLAATRGWLRESVICPWLDRNPDLTIDWLRQRLWRS